MWSYRPSGLRTTRALDLGGGLGGEEQDSGSEWRFVATRYRSLRRSEVCRLVRRWRVSSPIRCLPERFLAGSLASFVHHYEFVPGHAPTTPAPPRCRPLALRFSKRSPPSQRFSPGSKALCPPTVAHAGGSGLTRLSTSPDSESQITPECATCARRSAERTTGRSPAPAPPS